MNTNIWNSPQMGGAGGALKALAKNLANQLNLNRTEMKRVVARVISECHGKGNVGDYNGHMFYVKPQRIDITEQIVQSKEVFDEMLHQKKLGSKRPFERSPSDCRSLTYKMTVSDKPEKSLTGVIIDQNHLRNRSHPTDIVVEMSKCLGQSKSKVAVKRGPSAGSKKLAKRAPAAARSVMLMKPKSVGKTKQQKKTQLTRLGKTKQIAKAPVNAMKSSEVPVAKPAKQQEQQQQQQQQQHQQHQHQQQQQQQQQQPQPLPHPQQPQQLQHLQQHPQQPQQAQQPQQPQHQPSRHVLRTSRPRQPAGEMQGHSILSMKHHAGNRLNTYPSHMRAKPQKTYSLRKAKSTKMATPKPHTIVGRNIFENKVKKRTGRLAAGGILPKGHRGLMLPAKKADNSMWRATCKFQSDAGRVYRPSPSNNNNNYKNNNNNIRRSRVSPQMGWRNSRPVHNSNGYRRLWHTRSQDRLLRDLEREEAIDDPDCLEFIHMNRYGDATRPRMRRPYKISARLQELAQPSLHRRCILEPAPVRSRPPVFQPRTKARSHHRRRRFVIDSSLGSIFGQRPNSRSGLSPAKRNLTLAFMNKDSPRSQRSPRHRRSVLWR